LSALREVNKDGRFGFRDYQLSGRDDLFSVSTLQEAEQGTNGKASCAVAKKSQDLRSRVVCMFKIRNTTDRQVVIDDLRIILGPSKEIDLDRVAPRHLIDASPKLRLAFQQKRVVTVARDGDPVASSVETITPSSLKHMEDRLKADFRKHISALTPADTNDTTKQLADLTNTIRLLAEQLKSRGSAQRDVRHSIDPVETSNSDSPSSDIADDIVSRIHAKTMKRLEGKVTGHVEQESKKITGGDNITKNVDVR
jgi:hypothetical protein